MRKDSPAVVTMVLGVLRVQLPGSVFAGMTFICTSVPTVCTTLVPSVKVSFQGPAFSITISPYMLVAAGFVASKLILPPTWVA